MAKTCCNPAVKSCNPARWQMRIIFLSFGCQTWPRTSSITAKLLILTQSLAADSARGRQAKPTRKVGVVLLYNCKTFDFDPHVFTIENRPDRRAAGLRGVPVQK
jgi:hypothetical protein